MAKITAIAPWFGSKRTMASMIVDVLGGHKAYWEPFCGSMAVLFAKEPSQQETVNDLHGHLINLARVLADPEQGERLYARAARTLCSIDLYYQSAKWLDALPDDEVLSNPEAAYHYLVISWMGRNGISGCVRKKWQPAKRFTPGGGSSSTRWRSAVESIPDWHERLRNPHILNEDAFGLIEKIADVEGVAIYADPPYMRATRGSGGNSRYLHDFNERAEPLFNYGDDHERLREALGRFQQARVVVSYYDHPRIRQLYDGWRVIKCTRQKNLHVQNRRGQGQCDAPEILLVNESSSTWLAGERGES